MTPYSRTQSRNQVTRAFARYEVISVCRYGWLDYTMEVSNLSKEPFEAAKRPLDALRSPLLAPAYTGPVT